MNAAEKLLAIKGLIAGLQAAEAVQREIVLELQAQFGASSFKNQLGSVSVAFPEPKISVTSEADLLAWVEERFPSEVETIRQVRPKSREVLLGQLTIAGDEVIDANGEVVPWATVTQSDKYVSGTVDKTVKAAAVDQVGTALDGMLSVLEIGSGS